MTIDIVKLVDEKIQFDLSPEQVSGWLKEEHNMSISHERIYQHVWQKKQAKN